MAFSAKFECPSDADYCDFLIIQYSNGRDIGSSGLRLDGGDTAERNADEETLYVGVKNGSARGLEQEARQVSGSVNGPFLKEKSARMIKTGHAGRSY